MRRERGAYRYSRLQKFEGYPNDAYRPGGKAPGPVLCPGCGALFSNGRWRWGEPPAGAKKLRCPACRRSREGMAAGYVSISGDFFRQRRDEILARVRHCEAQERAAHPLERIIGIARDGDGAQVTTTSTHLARLIGHALQHAFKGELHTSFGRGENLVRIRWSRSAPRARGPTQAIRR